MAQELATALLAAALVVLAALAALYAVLTRESGPRRPKGPSVSKEEWLQQLQVSEQEAAEWRQQPQRLRNGQANLDWIRGRRHRLTASRFALAAEASVPGNMDAAKKVVTDMLLLPEAIHGGNSKFGIGSEGRARGEYKNMRLQRLRRQEKETFGVREVGLCIHLQEPWLAASPDGLVKEKGEVGSLEIKCCRHESQMFSIDPIDQKFYDQMIGQMAVMSSCLRKEVGWCDFFVWCPYAYGYRRLAFDKEYWFDKLLPKLRAYYFGMYFPIAREIQLKGSHREVKRRAEAILHQLNRKGWPDR